MTSDAITLCADCRQHHPLQPFWKFKDAEYWWIGGEDNVRLLCADCHALEVEDRLMNSGAIPYWYSVGMALRDYVWPEPELTLKQESLL